MGRGSKGKPRLKGPPVSITHPEVILQWNDENYKPEELSHGSDFKINWKCERCEHEWRISLNARTSKGELSGCPHCKNGYLIPPFDTEKFAFHIDKFFDSHSKHMFKPEDNNLANNYDIISQKYLSVFNLAVGDGKH